MGKCSLGWMFFLGELHCFFLGVGFPVSKPLHLLPFRLIGPTLTRLDPKRIENQDLHEECHFVVCMIACESGREEPLSTHTHSPHVYFFHRGGACVWLCGKSVNDPPTGHRGTTLVRLVLFGPLLCRGVKEVKCLNFK